MSDVGFRVLSCLGSGESAGKEDFGCRNFGFRVWSGFIAAYLFLRLAGAWRVRRLSFDFRGDWRGWFWLGGVGDGGGGGGVFSWLLLVPRFVFFVLVEAGGVGV